jgi:hypothetical protein
MFGILNLCSGRFLITFEFIGLVSQLPTTLLVLNLVADENLKQVLTFNALSGILITCWLLNLALNPTHTARQSVHRTQNLSWGVCTRVTLGQF